MSSPAEPRAPEQPPRAMSVWRALPIILGPVVASGRRLRLEVVLDQLRAHDPQVDSSALSYEEARSRYVANLEHDYRADVTGRFGPDSPLLHSIDHERTADRHIAEGVRLKRAVAWWWLIWTVLAPLAAVAYWAVPSLRRDSGGVNLISVALVASFGLPVLFLLALLPAALLQRPFLWLATKLICRPVLLKKVHLDEIDRYAG